MSFLVLTTALSSTACSDGASADADPCAGAPSDSEACLQARYLAAAWPSAPPCEGATRSTQDIGQRREVFFLHAGNVSDGTVSSYGSALQGFYQPYGLTFFMRSAPERTELRYVINGTSDDFDEAAASAGVEPGTTPSAAQKKEIARRVDEIMFGPLREFVLAQSSPPQDRVNIVVLSEIMAPAVASTIDGVVGGIGLSPQLFRDLSASDPQSNLFEIFGLPEDFTPTLFLGHSSIARFNATRETIVAHEMGHALGLQHTSTPGNVMMQGGSTKACIPGIDDGQIGKLKQGLSTEGAMTPRESMSVLLEIRRSATARALARARESR